MKFEEQLIPKNASFREYLSPDEWHKFTLNVLENQSLQWLVDCKQYMDQTSETNGNVHDLFYGIRDAIIGRSNEKDQAEPMMSPLEVSILQRLVDKEGTHTFTDAQVHEAIYLLNALRAWELSKSEKILIYGMDYRGLIQAAELEPVNSPEEKQQRKFVPISIEPMNREGQLYIGHTQIPVEAVFDGSITGTTEGVESAQLRLNIIEELWPMPRLDRIETILAPEKTQVSA